MFEDLFGNQNNDLDEKVEAEATANEWDTGLNQKKPDTWNTGQVKDDVWSVG